MRLLTSAEINTLILLKDYACRKLRRKIFAPEVHGKTLRYFRLLFPRDDSASKIIAFPRKLKLIPKIQLIYNEIHDSYCRFNILTDERDEF